MKYFKTLFLIFCINYNVYSQNITNIFIDETWTISNNESSIKNNEAIIVNNGSGAKSISKIINIQNITYNNLYLQVDVRPENTTNGYLPFHTPRIKVINADENHSENGTTLKTLTVTKAPNNKYITVTLEIKNFSAKNINFIKIELSTLNVLGTVKFTNLKLLDQKPEYHYAFPFDNINDTTTYLNIKTDEYHLFENNLLSTNSHFSWVDVSWDTERVIKAIEKNFPMSNLRFPGGTVGNFYNYANDGFYDNENTSHSNTAVRGITSGFQFNFDGYKNLCINNNASSTLMFNLVSDNSNTSLLRYQDRIDKGLNIEWIELGNENYFNDQQIGLVSNINNYLNLAKLTCSKIKNISPDQKITANIHSDEFRTDSWNYKIWTERAYFDALVMHPYFNNNYSQLNEALVYHYTHAYSSFLEKIERYKTLFTENNITKPIILTEWGILTDNAQNNFSQVLASADMFLAIEKTNEQGIVKQAGIHMLLHSDKYSQSTLMFNQNNKIVLTAMGIMYASLFDTFKNNNILNAYSTGPILENGIEGVRAKAIDTETEYKIFAVNKMNTSSQLNLKFNNKIYKGDYTINTYSENIYSELSKTYTDKLEPWITSASTGDINIPENSISIINITKDNLEKENSLSSKHQIFKKLFNINSIVKNNLNIDTSLKIKEYIITNSLGQNIKKGKFTKTINLSRLNKNIYLLSLISKTGNIYKTKIIKL